MYQNLSLYVQGLPQKHLEKCNLHWVRPRLKTVVILYISFIVYNLDILTSHRSSGRPTSFRGSDRSGERHWRKRRGARKHSRDLKNDGKSHGKLMEKPRTSTCCWVIIVNHCFTHRMSMFFESSQFQTGPHGYFVHKN